MRKSSARSPATTETTMIQYWKQSRGTSRTAGSTSNDTSVKSFSGSVITSPPTGVLTSAKIEKLSLAMIDGLKR
jgi:hypothetical protein